MHFKGGSGARILAVAAALTLAASGCSRENEPYQQPLSAGAGKTQCLKDAPQSLESFLLGEITPDKNAEFWDCLIRAVRLFKTYVRGQEKLSYQSTELRQFLHTFFLGEVRISDDLLRDLMEIKRLVVGGDADRIRHAELDQTIEFFTLLKELSLRLIPHMRVISGPFSPRGQVQPEPEAVVAAIAELRATLAEAGRRIERTGISYGFDQLRSLLLNLEEFFRRYNSGTKIGEISSGVPVLARLKSLLVSPDLEAIAPADWPRLLTVGTEFFDIWLRYTYFLAGKEWRVGQGFDQLVYAVRTGLHLVERPLSERPDQRFLPEEMHELWREIRTAAPAGKEFDLEVLLFVWDLLMERILPAGVSEGEAPGLTLAKLGVFRAEFERWRETQEFLIARIPKFGVTTTELEAHFGKLGPWNVSPIAEFRRLVLAAPWPLTADPHGRLVLDRIQVPRHTLESLTQLNLEKTLIRQVLRAYATNPEEREKMSGLRLEELEAAFTDLKPLAVQLGLLDADNMAFHRRIHRESSIFLPRSDGDAFLSYEEGFEYFHYAMAGLRGGRYLFALLKSACGEVGGGGLDPGCFRREMPGRWPEALAHLPEFAEFARGLSPAERGDLLAALEQAVRDPAEGTPVSLGDLVEMNVVLLYIETFLHRFDRDRSGTLGVDEVVNFAFPIYARVLRELIPFLQSDEDVLAFFTYLFRYGQPPDPSIDILAELRFRHWKFHPSLWSFASDRVRLAQILSALAKFSR